MFMYRMCRMHMYVENDSCVEFFSDCIATRADSWDDAVWGGDGQHTHHPHSLPSLWCSQWQDRSQDDWVQKLAQIFFLRGLSRNLSLAKGNPQGSRGGKANTWLSTLTSRTEQVVPHYVSLVIAAGTAQQSWPALPTWQTFAYDVKMWFCIWCKNVILHMM